MTFSLNLKATKFRDEARPRGGLLRGREFLMKDMYSFDKTQEDAQKTYYQVLNAYKRIFERLQVSKSILISPIHLKIKDPVCCR